MIMSATHTSYTPDPRLTILSIEKQIAVVTDRRRVELDRLEGRLDQAVLAVIDNEGAGSDRFVAVR